MDRASERLSAATITSQHPEKAPGVAEENARVAATLLGSKNKAVAIFETILMRFTTPKKTAQEGVRRTLAKINKK